jgi:hypothetical protein
MRRWIDCMCVRGMRKGMGRLFDISRLGSEICRIDVGLDWCLQMKRLLRDGLGGGDLVFEVGSRVYKGLGLKMSCRWKRGIDTWKKGKEDT